MTDGNTRLGTGTDWVDGHILYAADLNLTINCLATGVKLPLAVYTGTGFNATSTGTGGAVSNNTTLSITAANLVSCNYVQVNVVVSSSIYAPYYNHAANTQLTIDARYTGSVGGWTSILPLTDVLNLSGASATGYGTNALQTISLIFALDSNMKASGVDVKITGTANANYAGTSTVLANVQTFFRVLN